MLSFKIVSDPYLKTVKVISMKLGTNMILSDNVQRKDKKHKSTHFFFFFFLDTAIRVMVIHPSVNICKHPSIGLTVWVCFSL